MTSSNNLDANALPCIKALRDKLLESPPYCSGTLALDRHNFLLYYGDTPARRVDLSRASSEQLDELEKACQPATFGRNDQDVLDESYRKAGKMNRDEFVIGLDPTESGLLNAVNGGLLRGTGTVSAIRAELYKLNVYGKDAFFKSHKDTPRGETMFGSLVVVFPTPHEGGALVLRHEDHEWTFDSGAMFSALEKKSSSIAFVAFFSDVDHEVTPMTSGHRVTITYNLYFPPADFDHPDPRSLVVERPLGANTSAVSNALTDLLGEPTFLPNGGTLGFGLRHQYPLPKTWSDGDPNPLVKLQSWLKGSDAALFRACTSLGLHPLLRLAYEDDSSFGLVYVLMNMPMEFPCDIDDSAFDMMCDRYGGVRMYYQRVMPTSAAAEKKRRRERGYYATEADETKYGKKHHWHATSRAGWDAVTVHMITKMTRWNKVRSAVLVYGNESWVSHLYAHVCLIVDIGPYGQREDVDMEMWDSQPSENKEDWTGSAEGSVDLDDSDVEDEDKKGWTGSGSAEGSVDPDDSDIEAEDKEGWVDSDGVVHLDDSDVEE